MYDGFVVPGAAADYQAVANTEGVALRRQMHG
jgi:hypothetical protein